MLSFMRTRSKRKFTLTALILLLGALIGVAVAHPQVVTEPAEAVLESYRTEFTRPGQFDPKSFTLMIHAYNPFMARGFVEQLKEQGTYDPKRDINLLKEPERLREKGVVSASIITADLLPTFGRLIFILDFEPEAILATSPEDGYFIYKKAEILAAPPGPTITPGQMIAATKPDEYNEVLLRSENLKLSGVAVKHMVRHDGVVDTPAEAEELRALAEDRGLPVIELYQNCPLKDQPLEIGTGKDGKVNSLSLVHKGVGYFFNGHMQQRYFHPNKMDWEDISESEYQELRPLFLEALKDKDQGLAFLRSIDSAMQRKFDERK